MSAYQRYREKKRTPWECISCGMRNNYVRNKCQACFVNKPPSLLTSASKFNVLEILESKAIDTQFFKHVKQVIDQSNVSVEWLTNVQPIMNAYLNDINRSLNSKYIIPTVICVLCVNYCSQNIYPLLSDEEINDNNLTIRTIESNDNIIGFATKESQYHWREKLICNKLNGMIVIDLKDDVQIKWKTILCENNGNIFIRCNNLILDSTKIRTRKQTQYDTLYNKRPLKSELETIKQTEIVNNPNIFGNVVLIVNNLLCINDSRIWTGFLYIECGKIQIGYGKSYLIGSRGESIIKVNGKPYGSKFMSPFNY
eukprot:447115_1